MIAPVMYQRYRHVLERFCFYNAEVERMGDMVSKGCVIDRRRLVYAAYQADAFRNDLLELKSLMGETDGLSFMEDNTFVDFRVKDGKLYGGTKEGVYAFTERWVCNFPFESCNLYRFEVSTFVRALIDPEFIPGDEAYPLSLRTPPPLEAAA